MSLSAPQSRWVAAGLASITGDAGGPCFVPPTGVVERIEQLAAPGVDPLALLGERAAILELHRGGHVSCGGATRLLEAADGWIAISLARPDDVALLPAWLGVDVGDGAVGDDLWRPVAAAIRRSASGDLVESGRLLGLPLGSPPDRGIQPEAEHSDWEHPLIPTRPPTGRSRDQKGRGRDGRLLVVDVSSLWAGPLCTSLLRADGAEVIKVESIDRPDGARRGSAALFDRLHAGSRSVALDFSDDTDLARLHELVRRADVVVEGSRPRALRQLGIVAEDLVASGPQVWISITGHGRDAFGGLAVGFGDDAAVAGGLVAWGADGAPRFAADAIADPLAGIAAHRAVLDAMAADQRGLIEISLSATAAMVAGSDADSPWTEIDPSAAPRPTNPMFTGSAPELGADSAEVLGRLGIS